MSKLVLYHFPGACSQVTLFALEAAGADYQVRLINLAANEHVSGDYATISPLAKVPVLMVEGVPLSENVALLTYLGEAFPDAGLFPADRTPFGIAKSVAGLSFCSSTVHPIVRGIFNPGRMTDGDGAPVRARSMALAQKSFAFAEDQLGASGWWFEEMSVVDVYLNWTLGLARKGGFDASTFPKLDGLHDRLLMHPAFVRTLAREKEFSAALGLTGRR